MITGSASHFLQKVKQAVMPNEISNNIIINGHKNLLLPVHWLLSFELSSKANATIEIDDWTFQSVLCNTITIHLSPKQHRRSGDKAIRWTYRLWTSFDVRRASSLRQLPMLIILRLKMRSRWTTGGFVGFSILQRLFFYFFYVQYTSKALLQ